MPNHPGKPSSAVEDARVPPADQMTESAHYLRQATITLRRRSSWLNRMWCKNRQAITGATTWKH